MHSCCPSIVLLFVVQFEFELNVFVSSKKKYKKFLFPLSHFSPADPTQSLFLFFPAAQNLSTAGPFDFLLAQPVPPLPSLFPLGPYLRPRPSPTPPPSHLSRSLPRGPRLSGPSSSRGGCRLRRVPPPHARPRAAPWRARQASPGLPIKGARTPVEPYRSEAAASSLRKP